MSTTGAASWWTGRARPTTCAPTPPPPSTRSVGSTTEGSEGREKSWCRVAMKQWTMGAGGVDHMKCTCIDEIVKMMAILCVLSVWCGGAGGVASLQR
jgi:hypothetical protein